MNVDVETAFGAYTLLTRLGAGGMGEVWRARGPDGDVVIKRILTHLANDLEISQSFMRELRLTKQLHHDNVVRVFGGGHIGDALYMAMEYLDGIDLHRLLRVLHQRGIVPPVGLGALVARDVARALEYAYDASGEDGLPLRLVHRDVTPTNVMLTRDGRVKLLDFGLAKALAEVGDELTRTGTLKGKFGYMAPEQIDGGAARHTGDQFSLGVVLHETLCGQRLFRGEHDAQTISNVKQKPVSAPSSINPAVPSALDAICMRALDRDPRARFRDCGALADALDAVVAELGFGARDLAALIEAEAPRTQPLQLSIPEPAAARETVIREPAPRARSRRRWWIAAAGLSVGLVGAAAWQLSGRDERPVAPSVPAPAEPTVRLEAVPTPAPTRPVAEEPVPAPAPPAPAIEPVKPSAPPVHKKTARTAPKQRPPAQPTTPTRTNRHDEIRAGAVVDPFAPAK